VLLKRLLLEVCSPCQNTCKFCAHLEMRDFDPGFQLDLDEMEKLIARLNTTGCRINELNIHGPGEPLLWKDFNQAIRIIKKSNIANCVFVVTNGLRLDRIEEDVWECLSSMRGQRAPVLISRYPGLAIDESFLDKHKGLYEMLDSSKFWQTTMLQPATAIYTCACAGPAYYKGKIYPHCGPPIFAAAPLASLDPHDFGIELNQWDPNTEYDLHPPCVWCWANTDATHVPNTVNHEFLGNKK